MTAEHARHTYPFERGGAAEGAVLASGPVVLVDLSARPRFGLKGSGTTAWMADAGIASPPINRVAHHGGLQILRLGGEDVLLLGENAPSELSELRTRWDRAPSPKGFSSWREEGWAWMRLTGSAQGEALAMLCALDLRPAKFAADEIAQTRFAGVEAVLLLAADGFDILFDITASAFVARAVIDVAVQAGER